MSRKCVFCGEPADSLEHAFPDWLSEFLPGTGEMKHWRHRDGEIESAWSKVGFDFKVRQVCRTCNNGWMSALEGDSKPLLVPMLTWQRTHDLTAPEQKKLGIWAFKTAIVLALITPAHERFVPPEHYQSFHETLIPPDNTFIWIAALARQEGSNEDIRAAWSQPERLDFTGPEGPKDLHGYRLSFSVGPLVFQVVWDPYGGKLSRPKAFQDMFTRIRPISKGSWPPGRYLTYAALDDLSRGRFLPPS